MFWKFLVGRGPRKKTFWFNRDRYPKKETQQLVSRVPEWGNQWAGPKYMKEGTFVSVATPAAIQASGIDGM